MLEIERKFLVVSTQFEQEFFLQKKIIQGYLCADPERTVRIRIAEDKSFLTIKGKSDETGTTRLEWEKEIALEEAKMLLHLCESSAIIEKTRYYIKSGKHVIEVDVFERENKGLIVAEIELENKEELFEKPSWLGIEVTNDNAYYNASLIKKPYCFW